MAIPTCKKCGEPIDYNWVNSNHVMYIKNQHGVFHIRCYDKSEYTKKKR